MCQRPPLRWIEVHSENYFAINSPARMTLRTLAQQYKISCHGVGLSLGSVERVNLAHLNALISLINEIDAFKVSEHLSWSHSGGHHFNDLLPLPYTEEALDIFCRNVLEVQDALKRPIAIENPSSYLSYSHSTIPEWEFLNAVTERTDCELLLDLNNIYVSGFNHGFDAQRYIDAVHSHKVCEIHLAGFSKKQLAQGEIWIDTHSQPVCEEVWQLYQMWLTHHGPTDTMIEWDTELPELEVLLGEAQKASNFAGMTCAVPSTKEASDASC
ncbi:DUF692 domain-containing protein [Vibrio sp. SM6]|uniref:DUF692 domain-containing protein n=2 Tax=Vibrio agarilyticus TaxID=2726741 RepID=A0A7X8TUX3_9VIBR|nr:DUF692 domain-containing protein [Vibrio agarilyticus]